MSTVKSHPPFLTRSSHEPLPSWMHRVCRWLALPMLLAVEVAVLWPSGNDVADFKDKVGPWFLSLIGKDVILNVILMAPLAFLVTVGWPKVQPWVWALAITALSALAETIQWAFPALHRRPLLANVVENSLGGWLAIAIAVGIMAWAAGAWPRHTDTSCPSDMNTPRGIRH